MLNDQGQLAKRVKHALIEAQYKQPNIALQLLKALRDEVGRGPEVEHTRAAAWLAIGALYKIVAETPGHIAPPNVWQRAIDKTTEWLESK